MAIHKFIEKNREKMISDIVDFVNIPSLYCAEETTKDMPFGKNISKGLDWVLDKAESMGMTVRNIDGYAGEISVGNGNFIVGILAHEDVVAAGEDWDTNPFNAVVKDNKIYGRGTGDDKGPLISTLYVMKYLMEEKKIPEGAMVRMIIGTDEEEEWRGIDYYTSHVDILPDYSIVPDGYFPLIFCEKGLIDFDLCLPLQVDSSADIIVKELYGGSGRNIVAGKAFCALECKEGDVAAIAKTLEETKGISIVVDNTTIKATAQGRSTHAMSPEKGENAISLLMEVLENLNYSLSYGKLIKTYNEYIGMDYNGEKFGCGFEDELSGKLTLNIGIIKVQDNDVILESNLRYPASMDVDEVRAAMDVTLEKAGFAYSLKAYLPPVYTEPDSDFVGVLMDAYQRVTGDTENKAFAIGGATYARAIPNAVAFGPLFPYEEELAHEANEYLDIDSLEKMTVIYTAALEGLMKMKGV